MLPPWRPWVRRACGANVTLLHQADEAGPVVVLLSGRVKITMSQAGRKAIVADAKASRTRRDCSRRRDPRPLGG